MLALALTVLVSLVGSFACSLCEAALYSVSDIRVAALVAEKRRGAALLQAIRSNIDRAIAAILTINTIANTIGAAVAGAIVAERFGNAWLGLFSGAFTLAVLFAAEIIPKSLGVAHADVLAPRLAPVIRAMILLTYPLVRLSEYLARYIVGKKKTIAPTEHEILAMTRLAARHGVIDPSEARMVFNALRLDRIPVRDIMTPRSVVFALPDSLPLSRLEQHSEHWTHSRLPLVKDNNPNEVIGIVHRRDVFDILAREEPGERTLHDLRRPVQFIRDDVPADEALERFLAGRQHMFIVLDQYGSFIGLVTLEDALETLLGKEIVGEHDPAPDMQALARERASSRSAVIRPEPDPALPDDPASRRD
ncbi:MAG: CNNM domain-containing protein [Phycisphaerales bacterium]